MPQIVDIVGYGKIEFPDGMSKSDMADALKKLPPKEVATAPQVEVSENDLASASDGITQSAGHGSTASL
jgi:hypothetical protein